MKSRDTLARLRRFQVDETRRRVAQIETMIAEFSKMARELDREIALEEQRSGISDTSHFAYPTYARAARTRRDNLQRSAEELTSQLDEARQFLEETLADPGNARILEGGGKHAGSAGRIEAEPDEPRGIQPRRIQV
jgi:flagellar protein FliJ